MDSSFNSNGSPVVVYDSATTRADPANAGKFIRTAFTGNLIPANRLDPVAVAALKLLPLPNRAGRTAANLDNFIGVGTNTINNNRYDTRVDWVATEKYTVFGRFTKATQKGVPATLYPAAGLASAVGTSIRTFQRERPPPYVQQYSADIQWELGRGTLFEIGYSGTQGRKLSFGYNALYAGMNINQLPDVELAKGAALREQVTNPFFGIIRTGALAARTVERRQLLRPFPQFLDVNILDMHGASSSFKAFNRVQFERANTTLAIRHSGV